MSRFSSQTLRRLAATSASMPSRLPSLGPGPAPSDVRLDRVQAARLAIAAGRYDDPQILLAVAEGVRRAVVQEG